MLPQPEEMQIDHSKIAYAEYAWMCLVLVLVDPQMLRYGTLERYENLKHSVATEDNVNKVNYI